MSGELMRYMTGEATPVRSERAVTGKARKLHDEVRLSAFKADGALALAGHIMDGVLQLDQHRRELAGDDPVINGLLASIENQAVRDITQIQKSLFNGWGL